MKPDIEIAREADLLPIEEVGQKLGIDRQHLVHYGPDKAKISLDFCAQMRSKKKGKLIGSHSKLDIILDEGGYGWEPSLYVLAHNPLELIDRTHQIAAHIGGI